MQVHYSVLASLRVVLLLIGVGLLCQCSAPVSVKEVSPVSPIEKEDLPTTTGGWLARIKESYLRLPDGGVTEINTYNYAVARLIESLEESGADPWIGSLAIEDCPGVTSLRGRASKGINPIPFDLLPADRMSFEGESVANLKTTVAGIGAPLVAVDPSHRIGYTTARKNLPMQNLTAVVRFQGDQAQLDLLDPFQTEKVGVAGQLRTMSANYGAAIMLGLSKARIDKLGLVRLLRPIRYADTSHLNFIQPYDPERIPVVLVHGLDSTPATFAPAYFKLLEDPVIRKRYQFWAFSYPSGYPYPYSAALLRRELDKVGEEFPDRKDIVLVGHSMGSLISRLLVTDVGENIWKEHFKTSVEETPIRGSGRKLLLECLVFNRRPEVERVVFFAGPHRGSEFASNWIGRLGSKLIKLPNTLADARDSMVSIATVDLSSLRLDRMPNSIDTLSPTNRFVRTINKFPISSKVPFHSVMGDRGDDDTPDSSDGVVGYWSSHLSKAESELIVPSGHGAHAHEKGIEELRRILHLHLKQ